MYTVWRQLIAGSVLLGALLGCSPAAPAKASSAFVAGRGVYISSVLISSMPRVAEDPAIRPQFNAGLIVKRPDSVNGF